LDEKEIKRITRNDEEIIDAIRYVVKRDQLTINAPQHMKWLKDEIEKRQF
jgi:hypothetical protein